MRINSWSAFVVVGGLTGLLAGCGGEALATDEVSESEVAAVEQAAVTVSVSGPNEITSSTRQYYTYTASSSAIEPSFLWYARTCPTASITGCTATWSYVHNQAPGTAQPSTYRASLVRDCTGGGTRTYQLKVSAKGWLSETVEAFKVTKLCGTQPL